MLGSICPEWSEQNPFGFHASGSPQSQQPPDASVMMIL